MQSGNDAFEKIGKKGFEAALLKELNRLKKEEKINTRKVGTYIHGFNVGAFTRFLLDINELANRNQQDCFSTSDCSANSMGNYLLRKGLEYLSDHLGYPRGRMFFDETIMLAADVSPIDIEVEG